MTDSALRTFTWHELIAAAPKIDVRQTQRTSLPKVSKKLLSPSDALIKLKLRFGLS